MRIAQILSSAQKEHLRLEMELFLCHLLGKVRLDLIAHGEEEVPVEKMAELQRAWTELKAGKPVAYLTHEKEFYGLNFFVNESVLIPRPCTELLVDWAASVAEKAVLEIGTGSGAVALALKSKRPDLQVMATDVSLDALAVARKNAQRLGLEVEFLQSDLLGQVPREDFDTLLANLPYIGTEMHAAIDENVLKYEPVLALFAGLDGLDLYRRLFVEAKNWDFKFILGEVGFTQGFAIQELATVLLPAYRFTLRQDLEGLDRHFLLERKEEI
ncbi:peptide chain release factor N(5)-glutamine methyltransferase [Candidatus Peregrinibacteria bacterium]|nr:MAG: peptide chain release factor N(5)-glutamine methyltransferase [Candidatus Peregrinibacteria bacterium]